jgi:hypothetical protein
VSLADDAVLRAMGQFHYLSALQVCHLLYSRGSLTYVRALLKELADKGLLERLYLSRSSPFGSAPMVYTLSRSGLNYLRQAGVEVQQRYRRCEVHEHSYLHLSHMLAVNDVLIAATLLPASAPAMRLRIQLRQMRHEQELKRHPVRVKTSLLQQGAGDEELSIVPDGWLDFSIAGRERMSIVLELDRGTEEQRQWRRKVRGLVAFAQGPYQEAFGSDSITIAVAVTCGQQRVKTLLSWTERELNACNQRAMADLFLFSAVEADRLSPAELFLGPLWQRPTAASDRRLALLEYAPVSS